MITKEMVFRDLVLGLRESTNTSYAIRETAANLLEELKAENDFLADRIVYLEDAINTLANNFGMNDCPPNGCKNNDEHCGGCWLAEFDKKIDSGDWRCVPTGRSHDYL